MCPPHYQVISFYHIGQAVPVKSEASAVRLNDPKRVLVLPTFAIRAQLALKLPLPAFMDCKGLFRS